MPPLFMIFPAKTKNGMARRANTDIPEKIRCAPVITAMSKSSTGRMAHTEDTASAMAMGTPARSMISRSIKIIKPHRIANSIKAYLSFPRHSATTFKKL